MHKYEAYKPSQNRFLGTVPSHWEESTFRRVCSLKSVQNTSGEELLSVFLNFGVVRYKDTPQMQVHKPSEDMSKYQLVEPGDLVLNNQQAWRGSVGVSKYRGIVSPAYIVMSVDGGLNPGYVNYMVRDRACVAQFVLASKGVGSIQRILNIDSLKESIFIIPPRSEQDQIVRYLDHQSSKINALIAAKRREIGLLKEYGLSQKNNMLLHGLTKYPMINANAPRWMGEYPAHWEISQIRKHFIIQKRIAGQEGYDVFSVTQKGLKVKDLSTNEGQMAKDYSDYQFVYPGDFAMNHMDLLTGYIGIADALGVTSPDYRVFSLVDEARCYPLYYLHLFQICYKRKIFYGLGHGAANKGRWRLPADEFLNFAIPLPPYEEQVKISKSVAELDNDIDAAVAHIEHQIDLLHELRTRLISDVVTGQIDVRGVSVPEFETIDETVAEANETTDEDETEE